MNCKCTSVNNLFDYDFSEVTKEFDRLTKDIFGEPRSSPGVNVNQWEFKMAGVPKDSIDLRIDGGMLIASGPHFSGRKIEHSVVMPKDSTVSSAEWKDGSLLVKFKSNKPEAQKIKIK